LQIHGPDYFSKANDEILLMAMIETKEGLVNLEEICATPGVDAIYIGPADLSFALGLAPRSDNPDPLHMSTCDRIKEVAHRHGKKVCMHCASAEFAAGAVQRGFDLVMITSDLGSMIAGVKRQINAFHEALKSGS
jgi:4-hydroxy-2-oxoheptanedioate aldolase